MEWRPSRRRPHGSSSAKGLHQQWPGAESKRQRTAETWRRLDPVRHAWSCLAGLVVAAPPVAAQLSARTDVSAGGRYVWHGLSRAAGLVAQPSLAVELRAHRLSLHSDAVLHTELAPVPQGG